MKESENLDKEFKSKGYITKTMYDTSLYVIVSLITKVINLGCNIFLARLISKEAYGITKVYLDFAFLLLLYFPRETIRKTAQKFCPNNESEIIETKNFNETVQLSWFLNLVFLVISFPLYSCFILFGEESLTEAKVHLFIYILSANLELLVEPIIIYLNIKIENSKKLLAMTIGNYTRVFLSCFFAFSLGFDLWSFTLARLLASIVYSTYLFYLWLTNDKLNGETIAPDIKIIFVISKEIFLQNKSKKSIMDPLLKDTFFSFFRTNLLKMILTYTEKTILSFYLNISTADKGEYSFVVDNFAIIIRFLLEPIEESFYNLVNKLKYKLDTNDISNDENEKKSKNKQIFNLLILFVRFMMIFGILLICYIFIVGKEVIIFVYTDYWGTPSIIKILKVYSIYVAIISINGIVEAYSNAVYSTKKMDVYNKFMIFNSFLLILMSILLTKYDITGLVLANAINMLIRISLNIFLLMSDKLNRAYEIRKFLINCLLNFKSIIATILCIILFTYVRQVNIISCRNFFIILTAAVIFIINCFLIFIIERKPYVEIFRSNNVNKDLKN